MAQVSHSIVMESEFSRKVYIHSSKVPTEALVLCNISIQLDNLSLQIMLISVDQSNVCTGHPYRHFASLVKARKAEIKTAGVVVKFSYIMQTLSLHLIVTTLRPPKGIHLSCSHMYLLHLPFIHVQCFM